MRRFVVALGAVLLALAPALVASATSVAPITIDDHHLHVVTKYGPVAGEDPIAGQVADPTPQQCQNLPGQDWIPIKLNISRSATTKERIATQWDATAQNDIDVYFFSSDGTEVGRSAGSGDPEVINLAGLPNGTYGLCVVNFNGVNTGVTIDFSATRLSLYHYSPPPATPGPSTPPPITAPPTAPPTAAPPSATVPPEVVATPGPNGPVQGQSLDALSGSQQASAHKQGHSALAIALGIATVLIALSGAGIVIVRIRRDTA